MPRLPSNCLIRSPSRRNFADRNQALAMVRSVGARLGRGNPIPAFARRFVVKRAGSAKSHGGWGIFDNQRGQFLPGAFDFQSRAQGVADTLEQHPEYLRDYERGWGLPNPRRRNPLPAFALLPTLAGSVVGGAGATAGAEAYRSVRAARRGNQAGAGAAGFMGVTRRRNFAVVAPLIEGLAAGVGVGITAPQVQRWYEGRMGRRKANPLPESCLIVGGRRRANVGPGPFIFAIGNRPRKNGIFSRIKRFFKGERRRRPNEQRGGMDLRLPRGRVKGRMSVQQAMRVPGMEQAVKRYRLFHGCDPESVVVYDDGRKGNEAGFILGRSPEVTYTDVPHGSNKGAAGGNRGVTWVHKTSKQTPTYLAHLVRSKNTVLIGDMAHDGVRDWLTERGER